MTTGAKKYSTNYKKKIDLDRDTFLPLRSPKEIIHCSGCGAFYHRRHWSLTAPPGFSHPVHLHPVYCPACKKIKEHSVSGILHLLGMGEADRGETLRLLRKEEDRAREKNPLERIMRLEKVPAKLGDEWKVKRLRKNWRNGWAARCVARAAASSISNSRITINSFE
jgi:hypothetical protein